MDKLTDVYSVSPVALCVENYVQSTLACPEIDTQAYFVCNVRHTSQSTCVSVE